jgi:chromosome segregation ATPase
MISGQLALREIERTTAAIRAEESECDARLQSAEQTIAQLRGGRVELLRRLAAVRLDAMQSENVTAELASVEQQALRLIESGKASIDALSARVADAQAKRNAVETDRSAKADAAAQILMQMEELQASVEGKVRASAEWIGQKETVDQTEDIYLAADAKADRAEADRAAKGKPYEDDPLFKYLWDRKFGTADYRSGFFVRYFDRKVAALVGYQGARANYAMLNEIPIRLRAHADRCRAQFESERQALEQIEKAGLEAAGSDALQKSLADAVLALSEADQRLRAADSALFALDKERDAALNTEGQSAYAKAVEILVQADSREPINRLYSKAERTRTTEDDALVHEIEALDLKIEASSRERADLVGKARALAQRRSQIEAQRAQFYRRGYDSPMGQFSNEQAISNALGGILRGAVQGAVLGQVLQGGYGERGRRADSGFGGNSGFNFPRGGGGFGGRMGGGGRVGGPGGGSGGGDGFRTGGGF